MGRNLVVQLWGLGNLIQMEPLLRMLGEGDVLCDPARSVHELAPLFPRWRFRQLNRDGTWDGYDDIYLGFPIAGMQFAKYGNRLHYPVWSFGKWEKPLSTVYFEMSRAEIVKSVPGPYPYQVLEWDPFAVIPRLSIPDAPKLEKTIAVSLGYWRGDGGAWARKNWGVENLRKALDRAWKKHGFELAALGKRVEFAGIGEDFFQPIRGSEPSLMDQIRHLAGCSGYLGNDTGFAHIAGALGLPSAVFTVEDKVKVRTAAPQLLQFGLDIHPEEAVDWLIRVIERNGHDGTKETLQAQARVDTS